MTPTPAHARPEDGVPAGAPRSRCGSAALLADAQALLEGLPAHLAACDTSMDRSARHLADMQARLRGFLQARLDTQASPAVRARPRVSA